MKSFLLVSLSILVSYGLFAQNQDCITALNLVTKDSITVDEINGGGDINDVINNDCLGGNDTPESQSEWYTFTAFEAGNFYFTIKPKNLQDDLDFYLLKATAETCESAVSVRCNASSCVGENGFTGMSPDDEDVSEDLNCDDGENGFVKDIQLNKGDIYFLLVNNFTGNAGYTIVFCGTAKLGEDDVVCSDEVMNQEIYASKVYKITPNPIDDFIHISDYQEISKIEVFSTAGALIQSKSEISDRINIDVLPGMYYCKLYTRQGTIAVVPFVKL